MATRYVIFSPSYTPNAGGIVVLHKLCHIINECGGNAVLYPWFPQFKITKKDMSGCVSLMRNTIGSLFRKYKTNVDFNTPVHTGNVLSDNDIVIYPEIVFGNPLKATRVIRWLLNKPGYFTGDIYYGPGELYFKFDDGLVDDFAFYGSEISSSPLKVIHIPSVYNDNNIHSVRSGVAYSIRKGSDKPLIHHPKDAILIDGMDHAEIARVFKSVTCFISYDLYSAYSTFAVLCGCDSVVIPDDCLSKTEWYPDEKNRYGIAYGFDDIDYARETRRLKLDVIRNNDKKNTDSVLSFMSTAETFFSEK
ncbi:WavQ [Aeromonas sp. 3925]|uniref:hypothetical protein n=1 Tax=Aeromonas genomosp. paramedia TaxID=3086176 RepID=UPI001FFC89F3|nr:hypothetical protein [Aeromonas genomosp. paramedia]MCK2084373.1 WavQ [Aeromonas genomosp. paramedia]